MGGVGVGGESLVCVGVLLVLLVSRTRRELHHLRHGVELVHERVVWVHVVLDLAGVGVGVLHGDLGGGVGGGVGVVELVRGGVGRSRVVRGDHDAAIVLKVGHVFDVVRRAGCVLHAGAEDALEVAELWGDERSDDELELLLL